MVNLVSPFSTPLTSIKLIKLDHTFNVIVVDARPGGDLSSAHVDLEIPQEVTGKYVQICVILIE